MCKLSMRGALIPLASELLGCPWLAPRNLRLANIVQKPRKPRLRRAKHSSDKYLRNIPTIQVFPLPPTRWDFDIKRRNDVLGCANSLSESFLARIHRRFSAHPAAERRQRVAPGGASAGAPPWDRVVILFPLSHWERGQGERARSVSPL